MTLHLISSAMCIIVHEITTLGLLRNITPLHHSSPACRLAQSNQDDQERDGYSMQCNKRYKSSLDVQCIYYSVKA